MSEVNEWNKKVIAEFRANEGKVGGPFEGKTLLLLHTTGAKSQQERINPVACVKDGDRLAVIASKAGAPTHPDWYFNIVANPQVTVEVGTETFRAKATVAEEPERSRRHQCGAPGQGAVANALAAVHHEGRLTSRRAPWSTTGA